MTTQTNQATASIDNEDTTQLEQALEEARKLTEELEKKIRLINDEKRRKAIWKIQEEMRTAGVTLIDLCGGNARYEVVERESWLNQYGTAEAKPQPEAKPKKSQDLRPKYFNPAKPEETWSGKGGKGGRGSKWIQAYWLRKDGNTHVFKDEVSVEYHEKNGTLPEEVKKMLAEYDSRHPS